MSQYHATSAIQEHDGLQLSIPQHLPVVVPSHDHDGLHPLYQPPSEASVSVDQKSQFHILTQAQAQARTHEPKRPVMFGRLSRLTFFLALSLTLAVITAIAIGAVLGSTRSKHSNLPTPTSPTPLPSSSAIVTYTQTPTATSAGAFLVVPTDQSIAMPCSATGTNSVGAVPVTTATDIPTLSIFKYSTVCGQDCPDRDLISIWAYSLDACIHACKNMNVLNATEKMCNAVVLRGDMGNVLDLGGNCFLKQACTKPVELPVDIAYAVLVE